MSRSSTYKISTKLIPTTTQLNTMSEDNNISKLFRLKFKFLTEDGHLVISRCRACKHRSLRSNKPNLSNTPNFRGGFPAHFKQGAVLLGNTENGFDRCPVSGNQTGECPVTGVQRRGLAHLRKTEGNTAFKEANYERAVEKYLYY